MPDYANMFTNIPLYQHEMRTLDPVTGEPVAGVLDPEKRYTFQFSSEQIPPSQVTPQQLQEAMEREDFSRKEPVFPVMEGDIDVADRAEYDYKTGTLAAQNEYLEDMKIADQLQPESEQHKVLSAMATAKFQSQMADFETKKRKWENVHRYLLQNPQYDERMIRDLGEDYYQRNPIFEARRTKMPEAKRPLFPEARVQSVLGELATNIDDIYDMPSAVSFAASKLGKDFATNYPEAVKIIAERARTDFAEPLPIAPELAETSAPAPAPAPAPKKRTLWQRMFGGGEPAPAEEPVARPPISSVPVVPTQKPVGYPDAVWNPQYNMWTVIKNGKIVGLQTK